MIIGRVQRGESIRLPEFPECLKPTRAPSLIRTLRRIRNNFGGDDASGGTEPMVKSPISLLGRGHTRAIAEQTTGVKEETKWPTKGTVREYSGDARTLKKADSMQGVLM